MVESDGVVSVCVTADRGDGSEIYTATLSTINTSGMRNIFGERERPNMVPCNFELHVSKKRYALAL